MCFRRSSRINVLRHSGGLGDFGSAKKCRDYDFGYTPLCSLLRKRWDLFRAWKSGMGRDCLIFTFF